MADSKLLPPRPCGLPGCSEFFSPSRRHPNQRYHDPANEKRLAYEARRPDRERVRSFLRSRAKNAERRELRRREQREFEEACAIAGEVLAGGPGE